MGIVTTTTRTMTTRDGLDRLEPLPTRRQFFPWPTRRVSWSRVRCCCCCSCCCWMEWTKCRWSCEPPNCEGTIRQFAFVVVLVLVAVVSILALAPSRHSRRVVGLATPRVVPPVIDATRFLPPMWWWRWFVSLHHHSPLGATRAARSIPIEAYYSNGSDSRARHGTRRHCS